MLCRCRNLKLVSQIRGNSPEPRRASRRVRKNMTRSAVLILEVLTLKKQTLNSNLRASNRGKVRGPLHLVESEIQMQENHNYSKLQSQRTTKWEKQKEKLAAQTLPLDCDKSQDLTLMIKNLYNFLLLLSIIKVTSINIYFSSKQSILLIKSKIGEKQSY